MPRFLNWLYQPQSLLNSQPFLFLESNHDKLLADLIEAEWDDRQNRRIERQLIYARFRYKASVEDVHYHAERSIDRNQIMRLAECTFIDRNENLLITGSTGIGKSYVASAIGHQACILGYRVLYVSTPKLFPKLKMAKADGSYIKELLRLNDNNYLYLMTSVSSPLTLKTEQH